MPQVKLNVFQMNYPYSLHIMNIKLSSSSNILNELVFLHWERRKMVNNKIRPREEKVQDIIL